jgi:RNA polymerase sigma-70 factor (ECF subfamily)
MAQAHGEPMAAARERDAKNAEFTALFEAHLAYVWTTLRRLGVHERDLEDVAHETFLKVYAELDRFDRSRPAKPWLFAFALRKASDYRKLARHKTALFGDDEPGGSASPGVDAMAQREREALVHEALETLDMEKRAVLVLADLDEQPMPEIAAALGIPLNTGYSRLRVARQELAAAIRRRAARRGSLPSPHGDSP